MFMLVVLLCDLTSPMGSIAIGVSLSALTYSFGHVSEAHFNPAITFSVCLTGKMHWFMGLLYGVVQVIGAMAGAVTAYIMAGPDVLLVARAVGTVAQPLVSAWVIEALFCTALILVFLNVATEKNSNEPNSYYGIAIGFTVLAALSAGASLSTGVYNPALATGMAFSAGVTGHNQGVEDIWIYWSAPFVGAVAGAGIKVFMNSDWHTQATQAGGLPSVVPAVEFLGTFYLSLVYALNGNALGVGGILLAMVYMGDHVCGVDFNPAVTLGAALRWGVPLSEYWKVGVTALAQFAGGTAAAFVTLGIQGHVHYPSPGQFSGVSGSAAFEVIWTALLVYVVCTVMTPISSDPKDVRMLNRRGFTIGFIVAAGVFCATANGAGASGVFNPALGAGLTGAAALQSDAPHHLENCWVYLVGPFVGSVLGAGLFALLHHHTDPDPAEYEFEAGGGLDGALVGRFMDESMGGDTGGFDNSAFGYGGNGVPAGLGDSYSTGYVVQGGEGGYGTDGFGN